MELHVRDAEGRCGISSRYPQVARKGVPHQQANTPPQDPTADLCLQAWGHLWGWAFSYERGTPVEPCDAHVANLTPGEY